ncbi:MAG TPA: efflux RND transporter periplasmic adaptor subunit [Pirellulales bacterium]|nr:efflux RND transporter periplasmic adaptor subunit [Pirellulales bacterium]
MTSRFVRTIACLMLLVHAGCETHSTAPTEPPPPTVAVSQPVQRNVTDYIDYTGRTDAVNSVDIRPRVTGYLVKMPFKEGSDVKKDDLLFEVDPRPYQAQYDQAAGQLELAKAQLKLAKADYQRALVVAKTPGAISQQDLDKYLAAQEEAVAGVDARVANMEQYKLNLDFCQVTSPIDGHVSRYYLTLGNLVNQDQTLLTTVMSVDPMYAYFDLDERTLLKIRTAINDGKLVSHHGRDFPVFMGLQNEQGYPHEGMINFVNNKVDPFTGTITLRGVFANPQPANGVRLLSPGMFVRVRIPLGPPHPALLVTDRAIGTDQDKKFVYVLTAENKIHYQRVTLGALQEDGLRVIEDGITKDDWIVVSGLQQVQPGVLVAPEREPMPIPVAEAEAAAKAAETPADQTPPKPATGGPNQPPAVIPGADKGGK